MLTTTQLALVLALATGLVAFTARRFGVLGLVIQLLLRMLLVGGLLLEPVLYAQLGLGLAANLILFISATTLAHAQRQRERQAIDPLARMGSLYALFCVALAGFVATGISQAFPLPGLPSTVTLASYWLLLAGLLLAVVESSVLGQGLAAMTALNGFAVVFLHLDNGLLMTALLSLLEIGLALSIAVLSEEQARQLFPTEPA